MTGEIKRGSQVWIANFTGLTSGEVLGIVKMGQESTGIEGVRAGWMTRR